MPKFAANLTTMFGEHPFLERIQAAKDCGFAACECQFPYDVDATALSQAIKISGLDLVLFNLPAGDWAGGERGIAAHRDRQTELDAGFETALRYAEATGCPRLHVLPGIVAPERREEGWSVFEEALRRYLPRAADAGLTLLIEPINTRDIPGYLLSRTDDAITLIERIGAPNLRLQLDLYHRQIMQGDLMRGIESALPYIGHIQIAGVPDRHEPDRGEVNYPAIFRHLDALGYDGWIGCEYFPAGDTRDGLGWMEEWQ